MISEKYGEYEIIDAHSHIFPEKIAENATNNIGRFYGIPMSGCGLTDKLLESGSKIGVSLYLVCSTATKPQQVSSINTFIAQECSSHDCFYGFGTAHPDSEDIDADIEQVRSLGLHGIKIHPDFQLFNVDSPDAYKIYERIEGEFPLLIHCGDDRYNYSAPERVARIHRDFPKLKIIAAHLGGYQCWDSATGCLRGLDNVRFDVSSSLSFLSPERAVEIIRSYGAENCFFGSDFPMWMHEDEFDHFMALGLSDKENRMIFAENFKAFFNIK